MKHSSLSLVIASALGALFTHGMSLLSPLADAQDRRASDELKAKSINIVDADGKTRLKLGPISLGDGIEILGSDGKPRAVLSVREDIALLQLWHKEGPTGPYTARLSPFDVTVEGKGKVEGQRTWASISASGDTSKVLLAGNPSLVLKDHEDKQLWKAP